MNQPVTRSNTGILNTIGFYLILAILSTLTIPALNLNSYFILLLVGVTLLAGDIKQSFLTAWKEDFFRACLLLFLVYLAGAFYSYDLKRGFQDVEQRAGLVVIPFILCSQKLNKAVNWRRVMFPYSILLVLMSLSCLVIAAVRFIQSGETHFFFYHELVSPYRQHAVYFSVFVFMTLVFLLEEKNAHDLYRYSLLYYLITACFIVFLILLSSKLVLILFMLYTLSWLFRQRKIRLKWYFYVITSITGIAVVTFTNNPVKARFMNAANIDFKKFTAKDLHAAYFNGIEFRLVQWKLVIEILNEKRRWLIGVSSADAQTILNEKYKDYKFYEGDPVKGDKGYLDYNVHNQYLQCLLQSGIVGLVVFLIVCYSLLRLSIKKKYAELIPCVTLFLLFCLTESVLQTQIGIISFTLFPLLIYFGKKE
jgi:O-antigen ligase